MYQNSPCSTSAAKPQTPVESAISNIRDLQSHTGELLDDLERALGFVLRPPPPPAAETDAEVRLHESGLHMELLDREQAVRRHNDWLANLIARLTI